MTITGTQDRLTAALTGPLSELGIDLEAVEVTRAGRRSLLRVVIDADDGVDLDTVAEATRLVSDQIDDSDLMGEDPWTLEVASFGVGRPLTLARHWRRNLGRLMDLELRDGSSLTGRASQVEGEGSDFRVVFTPEPEAPAKPGAKASARRAAPPPRELASGEVTSARVQVEFTRKD